LGREHFHQHGRNGAVNHGHQDHRIGKNQDDHQFVHLRRVGFGGITSSPAKLMCAIDRQAQQLKWAVAFIIKWNPRSRPVETIAKARVADADTLWSTMLEGKRECVWVDAVQVHHAPKGVKVQQADQTADAACEANEVTPVQTLQARRIYRLTERTIYKRGQQILLPEYMLRAGAPGRCACTALRGGKTMSYCIRQARQTETGVHQTTKMRKLRLQDEAMQLRRRIGAMFAV